MPAWEVAARVRVKAKVSGKLCVDLSWAFSLPQRDPSKREVVGGSRAGRATRGASGRPRDQARSRLVSSC